MSKIKPGTVVAVGEPTEVEVKAGRTYLWCACGRSKRQPYCDSSHEETDLLPVTFKAEKTEKVWLCRCKQTGNQPFCDGTHNTLS